VLFYVPPEGSPDLLMTPFSGERNSQGVISQLGIVNHQAALRARLPFEDVVQIDLCIRRSLDEDLRRLRRGWLLARGRYVWANLGVSAQDIDQDQIRAKGQQSKFGCGSSPTYDLPRETCPSPPTTYDRLPPLFSTTFPLSTRNYLCFL